MFFHGLGEMHDDLAIDEEDDDDTPALATPTQDDYDWLLDTIRRLCDDSSDPGQYNDIYDEIIRRGIIPTGSVDGLPPRFGSPFPQVYTTLETAGEGGYGKVLKIQNLIDKQIYALKIIELDRREISSAVREIQCLAHLKSPNVVRYYSSWVEEKNENTLLLHIQTEFIEGESLATVLDSGKKLEDEDIHRILWQIISATSEIHEAGIVHRDLRPANIMFREDGSLVIIDFGIASVSKSRFSSIPRPPPCVYEQKRVGSLTMRPLDRFCLQEAVRDCDTIRSVGTPMYSSPRQLTGVKSTTADDIYSFGIMMFELLSRFKTRMEKSKAVQALRVNGVVSDEFREKYPAETELILRMLSVRAKSRPSATEIMNTELFRSYALACLHKQ